LEIRNLSRAEIGLFKHIDRTETITQIYYYRDGTLVLENEVYQVPDWVPEEKAKRVAGLQGLYDQGATFFGAFDGSLLLGMAVLGHHFIGSGVKRLNLEGLWVSHHSRGMGVGSALFQSAVDEAQERGAKALYVSATPSENTVRFYRNLGCRLAQPVDANLLVKEPEDIHLELILKDRV
jgi:GNAT superfamily N-acetyltransferase